MPVTSHAHITNMIFDESSTRTRLFAAAILVKLNPLEDFFVRIGNASNNIMFKDLIKKCPSRFKYRYQFIVLEI